jgi:NAD-dependent SIR2 family protein deacetylase
MLEQAGNMPVVLCPACRKPMTPSEPIPITNRMSEIVYRCDACNATTLRTVTVPAGEPGNRRGFGER